MRKEDEIEALFNSAFSDEKVTPPAEVKENIDAALFSGKSFAFLMDIFLPLVLMASLVVGKFQNESHSELNVLSQTSTKEFFTDSNNAESNTTIENKELSEESTPMIQENTLESNNDSSNEAYTPSSLNENELLVQSDVEKSYEINKDLDKESESVQKTKDKEKNTSYVVNSNLKKDKEAIDEKTLKIDQSSNSSEVTNSGSNSSENVESNEYSNSTNSRTLPNEFATENIQTELQRLHIKKAGQLPLYSLPLALQKSSSVAPVKLNQRKPITLSLYAGGIHSENRLVNDYVLLNEKMGYQVSLELMYPLTKRLSIVSGIQYENSKTDYSKSYNILDSVISSQLVYTYDSLNNIVDSTLVIDTSYVNITQSENYKVVQNVFSLPIYLNYNRIIDHHFSWGVSAGMRLSYQQIQSQNNENSFVTENKFGFSAVFRPEITYGLGKMRVGVYGQYLYDFKPGSSWSDLKRKRYNLGAKDEGIAIRARQQFNENSKILCNHHTIPEMNHNEMVGWYGGTNKYAVLILDTNDWHSQNKKRLSFSIENIENKTNHILTLSAKGETILIRSLYLIHIIDWASLYLAQTNNIDSVYIGVIDNLKASLQN